MDYGTTLIDSGLSDLKDSLQEVVEASQKFVAEEEIVNQQIELTSEQVQQLLSINPQLENSIVSLNGKYYLEKQALEELSAAHQETTKQIITQNKNRLQSSLDSIEKEIEALRNLLTAWEKAGLQYTTVYAGVSDKFTQLSNQQESYVQAIAALDDILKNMESGTDDVIITESTKAKTLIDLLKEELEILDHKAFLNEKNKQDELERVSIFEQAQEKIHAVAEKYRKKGYSETSKEIRELQELWWDYEDEIKEIYSSIAEAEKEAWEEAQENLINDLNDKKEAYEAAFSFISDKIQEEIEVLEKEKDIEEQYWDDKINALKDQNDEIERQIELEELQEALARARQSKVLVYKDGKFQYVDDIEQISEAQKNLESYEREQALQEEVDNLEKLKEEALDNIEAQIENWEKYKEEWSSVVNDYQDEQNKLLAEQVFGIELEGKNWQLRLDNLKQYVSEYNSLMSQLNQAESATFETSGGTSYSGKEWQVNPDGNAPSAAQVGDIVHTAGGDYQVVSPNTPGANYNPESGKWSVKVEKNANGTTYASQGLSLVGEKGPELRVLGQGDGIIPADVTKNLWAWGTTTPANMLSAFSGLSSMSHSMSVTIQNLNLPGVHDGQGFVDYMRNNFWRKTLQFQTS